MTPYESFLQQLHELEPILKATADVEKAAVAEAEITEPRYEVFSSFSATEIDPVFIGLNNRICPRRRPSKRPLEPDEDDVEMADT